MPKRSALSSPKAKRLHAVDYEHAVTETWISLGNCATTLGLLLPAIKSFEAAVNHEPLSIDALTGLSQALRKNDIALNETVGSQASIERLVKALDVHPNLCKSARIFKEVAECYLLVGLNDQAHQAIQTAIQLCPGDAALWLLSAQALIRAGARSHAAGALTRCLLILPELLSAFTADNIETARAAHAELAAIAAADGNIDLSIAELTATLLLPPPPLGRIDEHVALWCALATAKERAHDIPGAIQACEGAERAVGLAPRILLTHAYLLLHNDVSAQLAEHAVTLLNKIITEEPKTPDNTPSTEGDFLPWYLLGKAHLILGAPRSAYDSYQVALRRASNSPITWLAVGKLYLELKQLPDALAAYSQALRLQMDESSPGTATAWDGLSCVYERCDDQLMDASDACARLAACFRAIGDTKSAQFFDDRSKTLEQAARKEGPVPALRDAPDVLSYLLRDMVALLPSERIAFVQQAQPSQPPASVQSPPASQTPLPPPPSQPMQTPPVQQPPQQVYYNDSKSPRQPGPLPPPAWSPQQPVVQQPYMYSQPPQPFQPPPNMLPPPQQPHRSPMAHPQMMQQYPVPQPPPYYGQYVPVQGSVMVPYNNWRR